MNKRDKFSIRNVVESFKREFYEERRIKLLWALTLFIALLTVVFFTYMGCCDEEIGEIDPYKNFHNIQNAFEISIILVYFFGLIVSGCLAGSMMFRQLGSKERRLAYIMIPQRTDEKFLGQFFFYVTGFTIMYSVFFVIAFIIDTFLAEMIFPSAFILPEDTNLTDCFRDSVKTICAHIFEEPGSILLGFIMLFFGSSFFVVGSTYFPKYSFIKTFAAVSALELGLGFIATVITSWIINIFTGYVVCDSFNKFIGWWLTIFAVVITLFNWRMAYLRLKNTDIN